MEELTVYPGKRTSESEPGAYYYVRIIMFYLVEILHLTAAKVNPPPYPPEDRI